MPEDNAEILPRVLKHLAKATPDDVRYIKLGQRNLWWPLAKETKTLRLGFRHFDFQLCSDGEWENAKNGFAKERPDLSPGKITSATNQVREFFELPESTLWFTLADGDLWWCFVDALVEDIFADGDVEKESREGARVRHTIDGWHNIDLEGKRLRADSMTSKITKVISFQETICRPHGKEDLLRILRCQPSPKRVLASKTSDELVRNIGDILDQLQFDDFELLVELIFSSSGWRRISSVGGNQKFSDMALMLPTSGERCLVQVKSQSSFATFKGYAKEFQNYEGYSRMFFAYHTPVELFENPDASRVSIWGRYDVAKQVLRAGLVEWVLDRTT
jgi:hypothetical protein